uniref:Uncharacterized protein n=1 Tax=Tanacetum cinerariifolium TaxID=118510 RepID=A0A699QPP2_TANCI|nr:hypothetical protein [Tanacetum cinerariifolium]
MNDMMNPKRRGDRNSRRSEDDRVADEYSSKSLSLPSPYLTSYLTSSPSPSPKPKPKSRTSYLTSSPSPSPVDPNVQQELITSSNRRSRR